MATFRRTVNKRLNGSLLMEELQSLGIGGVSWIGFVIDPTDQDFYNPRSAQGEYARRSQGGQVTIFEADPGELQFRGDSDPGALLDTLLTNHDPTLRSAEQQIGDAEKADIQLVKDALEAGNPLTPDELKAVARLVLQA